MKQIYQFYQYHVWSYEKLLDHLTELPEETLYAEHKDGFKSIPSLLVHVYNTDHFWL
ncbi:DinB family protein, partial [Paenibacillus senegalensis]|uniref:DinB family protein n=1 Tax=Paenibacillus senegalensis TaxID=1465766 RepID=UPI0002893C98